MASQLRSASARFHGSRRCLIPDGRQVGKDALIEAGWPGLMVEEGNLSVQITHLRKPLGQQPDGQVWIMTLPRPPSQEWAPLTDIGAQALAAAGTTAPA
jgi:hypothetical protein